jgi:anti-sigma B factor antagonist
MMNIIQNRNNNQLVIALEGRLDISTAPDLDKVVNNDLDGVTELVFDLEKLYYISSVGLRVLLFAQKKMNRQGTMKVIHVNPMVMDVFQTIGIV